ncbi:MAG: endonuclease/exonuclease/phosphatase family protein [Bacteroidia bacterium]|nr:endonuclease/exonuclease/phosphatase family protein [Bacteroidia bacterium]
MPQPPSDRPVRKVLHTLRKAVVWLLTVLYAPVWLLTLAGFAAPWVPVHWLPELQLIPPVALAFLPFHLGSLLVHRRTIRRRLWAAGGLLLCLIMLAPDLSWHSPERQPAGQADPQLLRILSFNVGTFSYKGEKVDEAAAMISAQQPDVVCLQEFRNQQLPNGQAALDYLGRQLGMPYYAFVHLPIHIHGAAIFSRYPILDLDTLYMPKREINSGILITVETPAGPVGVGNLHLSSFHIARHLRELPEWKDRIFRLHSFGVEVLRRQQEKVEQVMSYTRSYPYPLILTGDFNAVPHSRITRQFSAEFRDSFREAGRGLGWSFPVLQVLGIRIDYQWMNQQVTAVQHRIVRSRVSDHYPILGVYQLRSAP